MATAVGGHGAPLGQSRNTQFMICLGSLFGCGFAFEGRYIVDYRSMWQIEICLVWFRAASPVSIIFVLRLLGEDSRGFHVCNII